MHKRTDKQIGSHTHTHARAHTHAHTHRHRHRHRHRHTDTDTDTQTRGTSEQTPPSLPASYVKIPVAQVDALWVLHALILRAREDEKRVCGASRWWWWRLLGGGGKTPKRCIVAARRKTTVRAQNIVRENACKCVHVLACEKRRNKL